MGDVLLHESKVEKHLTNFCEVEGELLSNEENVWYARI